MPSTGDVLYSMNDHNTCMRLRYRGQCCGGLRLILIKQDGQEIRIDANRCFHSVRDALISERAKWLTNRKVLFEARQTDKTKQRLTMVTELIADLDRQLGYLK